MKINYVGNVWEDQNNSSNMLSEFFITGLCAFSPECRKSLSAEYFQDAGLRHHYRAGRPCEFSVFKENSADAGCLGRASLPAGDHKEDHDERLGGEHSVQGKC